jgi:hypothetical protein
VFNYFESQHLYPILIDFRLREARCAVSRKAVICFDAAGFPHRAGPRGVTLASSGRRR